VALSDDGLIGWEETKSALAAMEKLESIFSANARAMPSGDGVANESNLESL
jgi:hypothetical protein